MKDFKLIRVLKSLSSEDIKDLKLFIASPFFKMPSDLAHFLNEIIDSLFTAIDLKVLWNRCFSQNFNQKSLAKKLHEALSFVEIFLSVNDYLGDKLNVLKGGINSSIEKNISDLHGSLLKLYENELLKNEQLTFDYYCHRFYFYSIKHGIAPSTFEDKIAHRKKKYTSEYLYKSDKILNELYLSEKLRMATQLKHENLSLNQSGEVSFVNQIMSIANQTSRKESKVFYYIRLYTLDDNNISIDDIKSHYEYLTKRRKLFSLNEFKNNLIWLMNYAIHLYNNGEQDAAELLFNLYKIGLQNESFIDHGEIEPDTFRNIILNACRISEYDWALQFISDFQNKLNPIYRETAVAFNKARVFWYNKKYETVIEVARDVEFDDLYYNRTTKLMLMTSYYELEEFDALDSLIKSFNVYLRRKTSISQSVKTSFRNFNSVLLDIVRAKERQDKIKLQSVRKRLESKMIAPNKDWLLVKVEELEKDLGVSPSHKSAFTSKSL
jgi:hypothetical protein